MTEIIAALVDCSPALYAAAAVFATAVCFALCLTEWREAKRSRPAADRAAVVGRDQATAERRRRLRALQYRVAQRDARRI